jgi:CRISPR-associated endonuclease Csn1
MADLTLGLDLGSNSIGWALLDEEGKRVVAAGSRVFPEGVDRDQQGGEVSKSEGRRVSRGMRRQIARRARRKRQLRAALVSVGLLPTDVSEQTALDRLDPYVLRKKALDGPVSAHEFGRILVHLNQRRGFLSNRKTDRAKKKETSEMLAEISQLQAELQAAGSRTLGEHQAKQREVEPLTRIRGRHTLRAMFEVEFEELWNAQTRYHSQLLTDELKYGARGKAAYPRPPATCGKRDPLREFGIHGLIFFQRPLYWPKSVAGRCELEPKERRCPRGDRAAQRFRLLQEVNNLRLIKPDGEIAALTSEQRAKLIEFLSRKKERKFDEIRKHLGLLESYGFNLEWGDRKKLDGMPTDVVMAHKDLFGKAWWDLPEEQKTLIVRCVLEEDEKTIAHRAVHEWGLKQEAAESLAETDLGDGYSRLSRKAIEKLLPHLEAGLPMMTDDQTPCALAKAGYLRPDQRVVAQRDSLPQPPDVTNPIVRQALFEVRKLVNAIIREYGKPAAIHIELAREVKGSFQKRREMSNAMRERERRRDAAAERIREQGHKVTRDAIDRYLLWEEQGKVCMYSGRIISVTQLFGGEVDLDHILPDSRSLDNSLMNKVLCFRTENERKGNRTPHEWLAASDPEKYEEILQRAAKLPIDVRNRKRPRFSQKNVELNDFIERQLRDTAYITSCVKEYVRCLGADVVCGKGQLTAELRRHWGVNALLRDDDDPKKNRADHRHHAIDAIIIALTNRSRLQQLAAARLNGSEIPRPWPNFWHDVETLVKSINVSHRPRRKVAGALHEETIYGSTAKPGEFVYRKALETLTLSMVADIRDCEVKRLVVERLAEFGISPDDGKSIPKEVWREPLRMIRKAGRASTNPAIIRKVRLIKRDLTIRSIRGATSCVKPGSNHHVCVFRSVDSRGKTKAEPLFVSMLEAARRALNGEPVIQRVHPNNPELEFVMSLSRGEMVLATFKGRERLVWFKTGASTQGQLYFADHCDGRPDKEAEKLVATANSLRGRKVAVDILGRMRFAND